MPHSLTENQKILIEKYGLLQERFGLSPVAARINALMVVADLNHYTFEYIRETLQISKSATSTALNTLILLDYVNFRTELGDRKRYFYSEINNWKVKIEKDLEGLTELGLVLKEIVDLKSDDNPLDKVQLSSCYRFLLNHAETTKKTLKEFK